MVIYMLKIKNNFDLKSTITCGQIFRYIEEDNGFIIIIKDRVISMKEDGDYIIIESNNEDNLESIIIDYFDLDRNYKNLQEKIIKKDNKITNSVFLFAFYDILC